MRRTHTSALPAAEPGTQVLLQGWVHRRRALAKVTFLVVRDRSVVVRAPLEQHSLLEGTQQEARLHRRIVPAQHPHRVDAPGSDAADTAREVLVADRGGQDSLKLAFTSWPVW